MVELPKIHTREQYSAVFPDSALWVQAISNIAQAHRVTGIPVRGALGSNIVYRVGQHWIKLFAPFFKDEFEIELAGLELVSNETEFAVPRVFAKGVFDGWHYMVITHVDGIRIGDAWSKLPDENRAILAEQIASITRRLQNLTAPAVIAQRYNWNKFVDERFEKSVSMQVNKGLSEASVRKLESFVSQFRAEDFKCEAPVYLHADLTYDHFLIDESGKRIVGIIDFADSMVGHPEYDLIAFFCYLLKGHKVAQRSFYSAWGDHVNPTRLLMWIALHRFSDLNRYFGAGAFDRFSTLNDFAHETFA